MTETVASPNSVADAESCSIPFTVPETFCADAKSVEAKSTSRAMYIFFISFNVGYEDIRNVDEVLLIKVKRRTSGKKTFTIYTLQVLSNSQNNTIEKN